MPALRNMHRRRALFEQGMADRSATNMARIIHQRLAVLHDVAAELPPPSPAPSPVGTER